MGTAALEGNAMRTLLAKQLLVVATCGFIWATGLIAQESSDAAIEKQESATIDQSSTDVEAKVETNLETMEPATRHLILVVGIDGSPEFGDRFRKWAEQWQAAAQAAGLRVTRVDGSNPEASSRQRLQTQIQQAGNTIDELWIVMLGHGTFDGIQAKFNMVGDDVSANEMAEWLKQRDKPTVVINCASASAPFVEALAGSNRVIVTATKSGYEMSFCYFGEHLARVIGSDGVDLDKDQQTSLLEAVIAANGKTTEFYQSESRLSSEHALIEDNGDGRGTPVDWYRGTRVTRQAKDGAEADGLRANQFFLDRKSVNAQLSTAQLQQRNQLESELEQLRRRRRNLTETEYYQELEQLMLRLARLYESSVEGPDDRDVDETTKQS